ncbi:MAG TPA: hypothetical protein VMH87_08200 [Pseudomonadales bacterium]|nr:hypothetical protein [Pseudomonadales bacterium]
MSQDISEIENHLSSKNKRVRLKALKLLLRHPDASPILLARGLCSDDNQNFEFLQVFELDSAMRSGWDRLRGVMEEEVYNYLSDLYAADPERNADRVVNVLRLLSTSKALQMLEKIRASAPLASQKWVKIVIEEVSIRLERGAK